MPAALFFAVLIPLALAGTALINTGLGRSRNAAHAIFTSLCVMASAICAWVVAGQAIAGSRALPVTLFGMLSAGLVAQIPLGAGAERWRLAAACAAAVVMGGGIYPLFLHWAWNGGWLARFGFGDVGGSGVIHGVGGMTALGVAWLLGPRRGKYTSDGMPLAMPGHHAIFVLFGCLISLPGWISVNLTAALLFHAIDPGRAVLIAINTAVAAAAAALAAAAITRFRFGKPDASLTANGWVAGIAAVSAGCAFFSPVAALIVGLCAGILAPLSVELFELRLKLDDPGGSVSVHAVGGIFGLIAFSLPGGIIPQLIGIATLLGLVLPLSYGLNKLIDLALPFRVSKEGERQGMDLHELGAGAYPEFMTHAEDHRLAQ